MKNMRYDYMYVYKNHYFQIHFKMLLIDFAVQREIFPNILFRESK